MVSQIQHYNSDPQPGMNRGRGWYYYRGAILQPNGRRKRTWSKYNEATDGKIPHLPRKARDISKKEKTSPHKGDYKTRKTRSTSNSVRVSDPRRPGRVVKRKTTRQGKGTRGYY